VVHTHTEAPRESTMMPRMHDCWPLVIVEDDHWAVRLLSERFTDEDYRVLQIDSRPEGGYIDSRPEEG
jgi:hypothetical protein